MINIGISYGLEKANEWFENFIKEKLENNIKIWSSSDIQFYSTLYQSIFKFINQGICPLLNYLILDRILEDDNDFSSLVNKMFVIIEMDGFGYPMIDLLYETLYKKGYERYEISKKMMTAENIDKQFDEKINNEKGETRFELEQPWKRKKWI